MRAAQLIDQRRYRRWVESSHAINKLAPGIDVLVQGLGKLDVRLVAEDRAYAAMSADERTEHCLSDGLTQRITLSVLWTFGAYEVVRTLAEKAGLTPSFMPSSLRNSVVLIRREYERVRVPLAKFKRAYKWDADRGSVVPAWSDEHGISWNVTGSTYVSRRELSDRFLALLDAVRVHREVLQARRARYRTTGAK